MLDAVRSELSVPVVENYLPRLELGQVAAANCDEIAGPDGRQHTSPAGLEANLACTASRVMDELATHGVALCLCIHAAAFMRIYG